MGALEKIRDKGFAITLNGDRFEIEPASKLTEPQRDFLKSHRAEIIAELMFEQMPLSASDRQKLMSWLTDIGETDPEIINEFLSDCAAMPDYLAWALDQANKEPLFECEPFITCGTCQHFECINAHGRGAGYCAAGVMPTGVCHWSEAPKHCDQYQLQEGAKNQ